jgi:hypothetical protein
LYRLYRGRAGALRTKAAMRAANALLDQIVRLQVPEAD